MFMDRIEPQPGWSGLIAVRLLRRWVALREMDQPQVPGLVEFGSGLGLPPQGAIALASLFQLTEASLGRPLAAEPCCRGRLGRDERAILLLLTNVTDPPGPAASPAIPHGLTAALAWAVLSVRRLLALEDRGGVPVVTRCPFRTDATAAPLAGTYRLQPVPPLPRRAHGRRPPVAGDGRPSGSG
jgi:hypothetical protein